MPEPITSAEFAQKVKAQYPVYAKVPDQELVAKMLEKYPVYRTQIKTDAPPAGQPEIPTIYTNLRDVVKGGAAGVASTVFHGGDLIRRGIGMERVINTPDVQRAMTPPPSAAGNVGFYGEQAAEFMVPLGQVARVTKGARLLTRMAAEGAGTAGVAALQSGGDRDVMTAAGVLGAAAPAAGALLRPVFRGVQRAAAGAKEGGVGGAIAAAVRKVIPGETRVTLMQALKPRSTRTNFHGALDRAIPEIKAAESAIGKPIESIDDLLTATKAAKRTIQEQLNTVRGAATGLEIDGSRVADAMVASIPKKALLEDAAVGGHFGGPATQITKQADVYRRTFTLDEVETLLRETNAELDSFYQMYPQAKGKALASNPAMAALDAQAKAFRLAIDDGLDRMAEGGGTAAKELRRRYGSLLEVEGEAARRANVAARQQPESLSEQIGAVRAAGDYARGTWRLLHGDVTGAADIAAAQAGRSTAKAIKESQTTDALIKRAFAGYRGQHVPVTMPTPRPVRGLLPSGPIITPSPADASFVRGVPAMPALSGRPRQLPASTARITPPPADASGGTGVRARSVVVRDPKTGRMKRMYTTEAK